MGTDDRSEGSGGGDVDQRDWIVKKISNNVCVPDISSRKLFFLPYLCGSKASMTHSGVVCGVCGVLAREMSFEYISSMKNSTLKLLQPGVRA